MGGLGRQRDVRKESVRVPPPRACLLGGPLCRPLPGQRQASSGSGATCWDGVGWALSLPLWRFTGLAVWACARLQGSRLKLLVGA